MKVNKTDKGKIRAAISHDFFKTFDLDIVQGRKFKENITTDDSLALIVNDSIATTEFKTFE